MFPSSAEVVKSARAEGVPEGRDGANHCLSKSNAVSNHPRPPRAADPSLFKLSFTHGILTQGSKGKKRVVTMTTLPPKDPGRGRKKLARGSDSGTMPLSEPLELH
jgi:hypothetical protein